MLSIYKLLVLLLASVLTMDFSGMAAAIQSALNSISVEPILAIKEAVESIGHKEGWVFVGKWI